MKSWTMSERKAFYIQASCLCLEAISLRDSEQPAENITKLPSSTVANLLWVGFGRVSIFFWWTGLGWVKENGPTNNCGRPVTRGLTMSQVYDRPDWSSPTPLLRACGNSTPGLVVSSSNRMFVRMRSDSTLSLRGFKATYTTGNTTRQ